MASGYWGLESGSHRRPSAGGYRPRTRRRGTYWPRNNVISHEVPDWRCADSEDHPGTLRDFESFPQRSPPSSRGQKRGSCRLRGRFSGWVRGREKYCHHVDLDVDHVTTNSRVSINDSADPQGFHSESSSNNEFVDFDLQISRAKEERPMRQGTCSSTG